MLNAVEARLEVGLEMEHTPPDLLDRALQTWITPACCLRVLGFCLGDEDSEYDQTVFVQHQL